MANYNPFKHITTFGRASVQTLINQLDFTVGTVSQQILPANGQRAYLLIQNNSNFKVYIYFHDSGPATPTNGLLLQAGQSFEPKKVPIEPMYAISNQPNGTLIVLEGV